MVEAGCWQGGSTAKFSIICRIMGFPLYVYDSFQGVEPTDQEGWDFSGEYAASLPTVEANLRRYGEAAEHYRAAAQLDPDMGFAYTNLGNALRNLGRLEEAVAQYATANRIRPDDARNHNEWGRALGRLDRAEEALAHFEEAVRLKPDYAEAYRNLGVTLLGLGRVDEAAEQLRTAVSLNPNDASARRLLEGIRPMSAGARED